MKYRDRKKHKGRSDSGTFTATPHAVQDSPNWALCSGTAVKLLDTLARQYNGHNNGDLCAALTVLRRYGWTCPETVTWALRELRHFGFIELTRQGGLHGASLYALTWHAIDDCGGKLDAPPTTVASGAWKQPREPFQRPRKKQNATTESVSDRYGIRISKAKKAA